MYLSRAGIGYDRICVYFAGVFPDLCEPVDLS